MADPYRFAEVLGRYVQRSTYSTGQLASLTTLPKTTIGNWLEGRVKRPRYWQGIVELALAMRLTEAETNELLAAAQQPTIQELRTTATPQENELFTFWQTAVSLQPPPIPFQAIPLPPYFVGREAEQAHLAKLLRQETHPAVTCLHGMAGVGKTTLAAQMAYQLRDQFADGVLWARLDSSDTMSILATFTDAYQRDVAQYHDIASRSRVVRDLLTNKQTLLVLDNAQTSAQIEPLLPPTGRCAVLVTTRRQDLAILAGVHRLELRPFSAESNSGQQLFAKILGQSRTQAEGPHLQQIAEALGQLPLALVIAASRLAYEPGWQTATFETRLQNIQKRLQALQYDTQSVHRSFQFSFDLLNDAAQRIFALLGLLGRQDFAPDTVTALTAYDQEEVEDQLRHLFSLSLLQAGENGRFQLHPLLHDFAQTLPHTEDAQTKIVHYWATFVSKNKNRFTTLAQEMGHIRVALDTAVQKKMHTPLGQLMNDLMPFFIARGNYELADQYLTQAEIVPTELNNQLWLLKGQLERHRQNLDLAETVLEKGLKKAEQTEDTIQIAHFLAELGIIQNCHARFDQGKAYLTKALKLAQQIPNNEGLLLDILTELGVLATMEDADSLAEQYYREGLPLALAHENKTYAVLLLKSLGAVRHLDGDRAEAKQLFEQGYLLAQDLGFHKGLMLLSNNLAVIAFHEDEQQQADAYLRQALQEAETIVDLQAMSMLYENLAKLARHNGRFAESQQYFEQALHVAQTRDAAATIMLTYRELGMLAARRGDLETAVSHFEKAHGLAQTISDRWVAEIEQNLSQVKASQDDGKLNITSPREHLKVFI